MLTIHHLENSRSQRILWLLEELGVDYRIRRYERDPKTGLAPPELLEVHPLGKAPVVTDGDVTVAESGAIVEYLVDRYDDGSLLPAAGTPERLAYTYWLHYAEGSFMPLMILSLIMRRIETAPMPFFIRPVAKGIVDKVRQSYLDANVTRHLEFMESSLDGSRWFCGDQLTAADIQMSFAVEAAEVRTDLAAGYPNLTALLERIRARPAYQAAQEKGGPYRLMGADRRVPSDRRVPRTNAGRSPRFAPAPRLHRCPPLRQHPGSVGRPPPRLRVRPGASGDHRAAQMRAGRAPHPRTEPVRARSRVDGGRSDRGREPEEGRSCLRFALPMGPNKKSRPLKPAAGQKRRCCRTLPDSTTQGTTVRWGDPPRTAPARRRASGG